MSATTKHPQNEQALSLLVAGLIGHVASLLAERSESSAAQRSLDAVARALGARWTLTSAQYAEAVARVVRQQGREIQYQFATDYIRFICKKCPFGEAITQTPSLCYLIGAGLWCGAVQCFGYGKVIFKKRIAVGDEQCDIRIYHKKPDTLSASDLSPIPLGADVSENETVRRLRARVRFLERRVEELENTLEERKLIERAKGVLMERLTLPENEAMRRLQKESQRRNKKLAELARIILQAGEII